MALANIAVELANTGRRVLAVDFDLEAPGLDTFDILGSENFVPGIIDFVGEYLDSGQAPEVDRFIYKSSGIGDRGGLWIMPSGAQREFYATKFNQIDWATLYEKHDGYLLFEDLKEQWEETIKPDYVLIDSRTGHTDTAGICTRQLPDAVLLLFFPNEQNLRGLTRIVQDIRSEARTPRNKEIALHFVMSNVPDLDDEDRILESKISAFQQQLDFDHEPAIVHRYNSLALLNQVVFTKDRPKSRLAQEYRKLVQEIVRGNLADREGALAYIQRAGRQLRSRGVRYESQQRMDETLQDIEEMHSSDGEVLFTLGRFREDQQHLEQAVSLFDRALKAGYTEPDGYLHRARVRAGSGDMDGANEDAWQALRSDRLPPPLVRAAIRKVSPDSLKGVAESAAVASLDFEDQLWLAYTLDESEEERKIAVSLLQSLVDDDNQPENKRISARSELVSAYIGIGKCDEAANLLRHRGRDVEEMEIGDAFNYGMAIWGATGEVRPQLFERVVKLDQENPKTKELPNYLQCMSIACWASGDRAMAFNFERQAREAIRVRRRPEFSCWRYRRVTAKAFEKDLDEIRVLVSGDTARTPRFMTPATEGEKNSKS